MAGETMDKDAISKVEIDDAGKLHVFPAGRSFPLIYREAMEVNGMQSADHSTLHGLVSGPTLVGFSRSSPPLANRG